MHGQPYALTQTAAAYMHNDLETFRCSLYPPFGQLHTFFCGEHITLTRRSVDENSFQSVLLQHCCISPYRLKIDIAIRMERRERCVDQSDYFFHKFNMF